MKMSDLWTDTRLVIYPDLDDVWALWSPKHKPSDGGVGACMSQSQKRGEHSTNTRLGNKHQQEIKSTVLIGFVSIASYVDQDSRTEHNVREHHSPVCFEAIHHSTWYYMQAQSRTKPWFSWCCCLAIFDSFPVGTDMFGDNTSRRMSRPKSGILLGCRSMSRTLIIDGERWARVDLMLIEWFFDYLPGISIFW